MLRSLADVKCVNMLHDKITLVTLLHFAVPSLTGIFEHRCCTVQVFAERSALYAAACCLSVAEMHTNCTVGRSHLPGCAAQFVHRRAALRSHVLYNSSLLRDRSVLVRPFSTSKPRPLQSCCQRLAPVSAAASAPPKVISRLNHQAPLVNPAR